MRKYLIQLLVSVVLVAALFYWIDFSAVLENLSRVDLEIYLLAAGLFMTTYLPSSLRWKKLAGSSGHQTSLKNSFRVVSIAYSLNKLLPWNTGDFAKTKLAEKYQKVDSHSRLFGAVAMERAMDAMALLFLIGVSLPFVALNIFSQVIWIVIPFLLGVTAISLLALYRPKFLLVLLPDILQERVEKVLEGFASASWTDLSSGMVFSTWKWGTEAVVFWLLAIGLGLDVGLAYSAVVNSTISLVSALPISPAGLGPADATATGILALSGMSTSDGLSIVLLWRSLGIGLQGVVGALVYGLDL